MFTYLNTLKQIYLYINNGESQVWWFMPVIPVTWEAEIWRNVTQDPISTNKLDDHICDPSYVDRISRKITVPRLYLKNN
jgi:hypothetical protein